MEKTKVNGIDLAYERRGSGMPLLLVHGFPLDHRAWLALALFLEQRFDLILPDLRGFGQSDAPDGAYSMEIFAGDLLALLDSLSINRAFIAGHSMGGYVTLAFARLAPERVLGLGLLGSQAAADNAERKAGRFATADRVAREGPAAVAGMADALTANPQRFAQGLGEIILSQPPAGLIGALSAMAARPDASAQFPGMSYPLVLVHGQADALIPPERAREMHALLPNSGLLELPGVGHTASLEAPNETAQALEGLLGGV